MNLLELEQKLMIHSEDKESWLVYADWLQTQGDIRGELIILEIQLKEIKEEKLFKKIQTRINLLLDKYSNTWLSPAYIKALEKASEEIDLIWWGGFVMEASIQGEDKVGESSSIDLLLLEPALKFLKKLTIHFHTSNALAKIAFQKFFKANYCLSALKEMVLHSEDSLALPVNLDTVFPNLEAMCLYSNTVFTWNNIYHHHLKKLLIELATEDTRQEVNFLENLLLNSELPALIELSIFYTDDTDDLILLLQNSNILPQLKKLDLSNNYLSDLGGQTLIDAKEQFAHLEILILDYHELSYAKMEEIKVAYQDTDVELYLDIYEEDDDSRFDPYI